MRHTGSILPIFSLLAVCLFSSTSSAQSPYIESQLFAQRGYGSGGMLYSLGYVPVPPYFALHPPVYYSQPVPRTYGYSPYAYPGTVKTPEIEQTKPVTIINPFATPKKKTSEKKQRTAANSKIIRNPFATKGVTLFTEKLAQILPSK